MGCEVALHVGEGKGRHTSAYTRTQSSTIAVTARIWARAGCGWESGVCAPHRPDLAEAAAAARAHGEGGARAHVVCTCFWL